MYLHAQSNHPPHTKMGLPYSQALRIRRNTTENNSLKIQLNILIEAFLNRGYTRNHILQQLHRVYAYTQEVLRRGRTKKTMARIPLIITYYPQLRGINKIVKELWEKYVLSTEHVLVCSDYPIVGFTNTPSVGSHIMSSAYPPKWRQDTLEV